jgi:putative MATE family efflux protein
MQRIDMTEGDLEKKILQFSIPMFLASLIQNLYNIADRIWVGKFCGETQLSAVSVIFPVMFLILALSMGMSIGTTVLVSQNIGAKNNDGVIKTIDTSLIIASILSVFMTVLGLIFYKYILYFMKVPPEIFEYSKIYMNIILLGTPFVFFTGTIAAILRGIGDAKSPTIYMAIAAVTNIVLDPILITGIGIFTPMGVAGAAIATIFSQAIGFYLSMNKILKVRTNYQIDKKIHYCQNFVVKILKLGLPSTIQQGLISVSTMVVLSFINSFNDVNIIAAFSAGASFDAMAFLPAMSIGFALSTSAGQNTGAKNIKRIKKTASVGLKLVGIINTIVLIIGYVFARQIGMLFLNDPEAINQTVIYLRIFCFFYLPFGLMSALNSVTQGIGNTIFPMLVTVASVYFIRIPLAYFLAFVQNIGVKGVYIAMALSPVFGFIAIASYYYSGIWKKRVLKRNVLIENEVL